MGYLIKPIDMSNETQGKLRRQAIEAALKKAVKMTKWILRPLGAPYWAMGPVILYPETLWFGRNELGLVITAKTEQEARQMADKLDRAYAGINEKHPWLSESYSSCERLDNNTGD